MYVTEPIEASHGLFQEEGQEEGGKSALKATTL